MALYTTPFPQQLFVSRCLFCAHICASPNLLLLHFWEMNHPKFCEAIKYMTKEKAA